MTEDSKDRAIVDSGANVTVTSRQVADKYGVKVRKNTGGGCVQFGKKGSRSNIVGYGTFGKLIREAVIIEDGNDTLITVGAFVDQGMEVIFDEEKVYLREKQEGKIVCTGERDKDSGLYYMDMKELMRDREDETETGANNQYKINGATEERKDGKRKRQKGERILRSQQEYIIHLHERMNHISSNTMCETVRAGAWEGVPEWMTVVMIEKVMNKLHCIACEIAKRKTLPQQVGSGVREMRVGHTWSVDYVGPISPPTMYGATGFFIFKDMACSYRIAALVKSKTSLDRVLRNVIKTARRYGKSTHVIRVDAGTVENSQQINDTLAELGEYHGGMQLDPAPPGSQEKNPVEREVQTLKRRITTMLISQDNVTARYWGHALLSYIDTENDSMNINSKAIGEWGMTPTEAFTGNKPNLEKHEFRFGTVVTCQKMKVHKVFEAKNELGVVVGTTKGKGGGHIVTMVGKGMKPYIRYQIKEVKTAERKEVTEQEAEELQYEETEVEGQIELTYKTRRLEEMTNNIMITVKKPQMDHTEREEEHDEDSEHDRRKKKKGAASRRQGEYRQDSIIASSQEEEEEEEEVEIVKEEVEDNMTGGWQEIDGEEVTRNSKEEIEEDEREMTVEEIEEERWGDMTADERHENTIAVGRHNTRSKGRDEGGAKVWEDMTREEREADTQNRRHSTRSNMRKTLSINFATGVEENIWKSELETKSYEELIEQEKEIRFMMGELEREQEKGLEEGKGTVNKASIIRGENNPTIQIAKENNWDIWKEPVGKEVENIIGRDKGVVKEVALADIPRDQVIVRMMIDLTTKFNMTTGEIAKRKCRINCRGDQELRLGIHKDRQKLYSPTVRSESIMLMVAIAALMGLRISGWDVAGAFQKTPATRDVYVAFPKQVTGDRQKYYKLLRMLYGLPDASRAWYDFISEKLMKVGYVRCIHDPCVFIRREGALFVIVGVHVDDGTDIANCEKMRKQLHDSLKEWFEITEQQRLETQLGMHLEYNEDGSITVSMPMHTEKTILEAYPEGSVIPEIHVPINDKWSEEENDNAPSCDREKWRVILGLVVWLTRVRIDILLAVSRMCGRTHKATTRDMEHLMNLVAYIHFTKKIGRT